MGLIRQKPGDVCHRKSIKPKNMISNQFWCLGCWFVLLMRWSYITSFFCRLLYWSWKNCTASFCLMVMFLCLFVYVHFVHKMCCRFLSCAVFLKFCLMLCYLPCAVLGRLHVSFMLMLLKFSHLLLFDVLFYAVLTKGRLHVSFTCWDVGVGTGPTDHLFSCRHPEHII